MLHATPFRLGGNHPIGTAFEGYSGSAIDDSGIDYLGCMYKSFGNSTPYIKVPPSTNVGCYTGGQYNTIEEYNGNFVSVTWYYSYQNERQTTTKAPTRIMRMSLSNAERIKNAYIVNKKTGEYYFNGAEYTDQ